jgi:hypothetical protein
MRPSSPHAACPQWRASVWGAAEQRRRNSMSDCLHCDIHDLIEPHLQKEGADLADIAAKVTEVLADLLLMTPPEERSLLMADVIQNLGAFVLEKGEAETSDQQPGRSRH